MSELEVCQNRDLFPESDVVESPQLDKMLKIQDPTKSQSISNILINDYGRKFVYVSQIHMKQYKNLKYVNMYMSYIKHYF